MAIAGRNMLCKLFIDTLVYNVDPKRLFTPSIELPLMANAGHNNLRKLSTIVRLGE